MLKKIIATFILSACATGVMVMPEGAEAKWQRNHANTCISGGALPVSATYGISNKTPLYLNLYCPVRDDERFPKQEIKTLNVHLFDGHPGASAYAKACVTYWHGNGGSCSGTSASTSWGVENYTLKPSTSVWSASTAGHFGYVLVTLPPTGSYWSNLRGFFTAS